MKWPAQAEKMTGGRLYCSLKGRGLLSAAPERLPVWTIEMTILTDR